MILKNAIERIPGVECSGNLDIPIRGISYDSRRVQKDDIFIAVKGEKADGFRYIDKAMDAGATAVACERPRPKDFPGAYVRVEDARKFMAEFAHAFYYHPCAGMKLVAITGTKGKTTTAWLIDSIYRRSGLASCIMGTIENRIGDERHASNYTTPEAPDVASFFHQAVQRGCTHGVLEVSSHALHLRRVYGAKFTIGVFTNLSHDHLDFHQDMESYYQAKKMLFGAENGNDLDIAFVNADDPYGRRLADEIDVPVVTYGFHPSADIHVKEWESRLDGTDIVLDTPEGEISFHAQLVGRPNAYNIMAAAGVSLGLGLTREHVRVGIEALAGVPGRMERVDAGQDFLVIVDYAHSPASLENLLETAGQLPHRRIITVFGCGGDRDRTKRPVMGEIAARLSDVVVATSDNPRTEDPAAILREIEPGLKQGRASYKVKPDRRIAIQAALAQAGTGDIVVIAGKGHEPYQIVGGKKLPFDDRTVAREMIRAR
ncbi:MAG: UDP-N-acetylmuramoyl-L-alanyl-D-glutamate--2,6-diaminopimelate ligase [Acidobacteriota bacterium]|jgi:UDP-N-acetylmuramoyl-L-alanyl-D-glutamate--2,6-diaminopimelate ligase|nr:UDP-N-acetylmuramoyl-L-alanyl-D-glutamate--2,6-diaminopimelate ligase [Acidobacteriota bacterium]